MLARARGDADAARVLVVDEHAMRLVPPDGGVCVQIRRETFASDVIFARRHAQGQDV